MLRCTIWARPVVRYQPLGCCPPVQPCCPVSRGLRKTRMRCPVISSRDSGVPCSVAFAIVVFSSIMMSAIQLRPSPVARASLLSPSRSTACSPLHVGTRAQCRFQRRALCIASSSSREGASAAGPSFDAKLRARLPQAPDVADAPAPAAEEATPQPFWQRIRKSVGTTAAVGVLALALVRPCTRRVQQVWHMGRLASCNYTKQ